MQMTQAEIIDKIKSQPRLSSTFPETQILSDTQHLPSMHTREK